MSDYDGKIIHRCRDRHGLLVVADSLLTRTLYFGTKTQQSSMFLDEHTLPAMYYMRAMMSALIFNPRPARALFIGLGGGTTVNFFHRACPECRIEAVELRAKVIALAHDFFFLPEDNPRIRIVHGDGRDYLLRQRQRREDGYDHIFVDAFDEGGPAPSIIGHDFLKTCRELLSDSGVLTFDLWTHAGAGYHRHRDAIVSVFDGAVRELKQGDAPGNALLFAFKDSSLPGRIGKWVPAARRLEEKFSLSFLKFLRDIYGDSGEGRKPGG